jgi:uncharacterized protein DUF5763
MKGIKLIFSVFLILFSITGKGQDVYKTPSGEKYHLSSCRMVENVSKKLVGETDINKYHLTPCKICKPPIKKTLQKSYSNTNKAVGESTSVQCKGKTQKGTRCKHKTSLANGYCYQHTSQNSSLKPQETSSTCGARTKSGGYCKRKVKGGGRCYQHD